MARTVQALTVDAASARSAFVGLLIGTGRAPTGSTGVRAVLG